MSLRPLLALFLALPLSAQVGWQLAAPIHAPTARGGAVACYDIQRQRIVLFGGFDARGCALADTWEWDGDDWLRRSPATAPPPRHSASLAYDPVRREVVLFGGFDAPNCNRNAPIARGDTWIWDGNDWSQRVVAGGPGPRAGGALAHHRASGRMILFGGTPLGSGAGGAVDETWAWDGASWSLLQPNSRPAPRAYFHMTQDPNRNTLVLFGGWNNAPSLSFGDTWEFDGQDWTDVTPTGGPARRNSARLAYDASRARIVLYGGDDACRFLDTTTWEWNGTSWSPWLSNSPLGYRHVHAMAYHDARRQLLSFGGVRQFCQFTQPDAETWLVETPRDASFLSYGQPCGSPPLRLAGDPAPSSLPQLGTALQVVATDFGASPFVALNFGSSNTVLFGTPIPLELGAIGMPGCWAWAGTEFATLMVIAGTRATWSENVPNDPVLIARSVYAQAVAVDPAANPLGIVTSEGLEIRMGL